jgi:hypothetical protein
MKAKWMCAALLAGAFAVAGCGPQAAPTTGDGKVAKGTEKAPPTDPSAEDGGEWCNPHGILEEECSMCLPEKKVKAMFKDKGDWCDKHDRAKSQCFICDPSLMEKAKATYKAKYGKEMPIPKGNMPEKK